MRKNSTTMTFLRGIMIIFIMILSIHFLGFLFATSQVSNVNKLEEKVSSIRTSLRLGFGDPEPYRKIRENRSTHSDGTAPNPEHTMDNPLHIPEGFNPSVGVLDTQENAFLENSFEDIQVLDYWAPAPYPLKDKSIKKSTKDDGKFKKDPAHLKLFSDILQVALGNGKELLEENKDTSTVFLLVSIADLPFSSAVPPEKQLNPKVKINDKELPIVAVLRTDAQLKYILVLCELNHLLADKNTLKLNIGNPHPDPYTINFNKKDIQNGVHILKKSANDL